MNVKIHFEDHRKAFDAFFEAYGRVIAEVWKDPKLREDLIENPKETLEKMGVKMTGDYAIEIKEKTTQIIWDYQTSRLTLPLPPKPESLAAKNIATGSSVDCFSVSRIDCYSAGDAKK